MGETIVSGFGVELSNGMSQARGLRQHYELVHVEYCTADAVSDTTQLPNALGSSTTMYLYFKLKRKKKRPHGDRF